MVPKLMPGSCEDHESIAMGASSADPTPCHLPKNFQQKQPGLGASLPAVHDGLQGLSAPQEAKLGSVFSFFVWFALSQYLKQFATEKET